MTHINDHTLRSYDSVLDAKYGKAGTQEREAFEEEALAFFSGQEIKRARKEAKLTQAELADRIGANKSYISKIENGVINPSAGTFYRIVSAMGMRVQISK